MVWRERPAALANSHALLDEINWLLYPRLDFRPRRVRAGLHGLTYPTPEYTRRRFHDLQARIRIGTALRAWVRARRQRNIRRAVLLLPTFRLLPPALIDLPHIVHAVASSLGPMDPAPQRTAPRP